ncbi:MAG: hypothetical protein SPJ34_09695, partial [Candidatus Ornithospirochaeta sp.]|nr:hypothetical protein [Candidatus Ornithospirochaeta sp.]
TSLSLMLNLKDDNGDDNSINTSGIFNIGTSTARLKILSGHFYGNPTAIGTSYITLENNNSWGSRDAGVYKCGGLSGSVQTVWNKNQ